MGQGVFLDTDNSTRGAIRKIRQVLKDDSEQPRFIQTVTGQGYRSIAPVISPKESPEEENRADHSKSQPWAVPYRMPSAPVTSDGQSAQAPGVLAVSRTQRWKIVMPLSFLLIAGLLAEAGLALAASASCHGERNRRSWRFRQFDGGRSLRWNAAARPLGSVTAVSISEACVRGTDPTGFADDGSTDECPTYSRNSSGGVSKNQ